MKKTLLATTLLASIAASPTQAATILGFDVGAYAWQTSLSDNNNAAMEADDATNAVLFASLEHPIPLVPNVRLKQTSLKHDIKGGGELDASHTDLTLYYEILDNWVNLDLGITARVNGGEATTATGSEDIDSTLGLLYAKAQLDLPFTGLSTGAEFSTGGDFGNEKATDATVFIQYNVFMGLTAAAGYRVLNTELEAGNNTGDLEFDGAFISAFYHF